MACKDLMTYERTLERTSAGMTLFLGARYECKALWWAELSLDREDADDSCEQEDDDWYIF